MEVIFVCHVIDSFIYLLFHYRSHELMSVKMVDHIVDEHHIDIDSGMIKRVKVYL